MGSSKGVAMEGRAGGPSGLREYGAKRELCVCLCMCVCVCVLYS